MLSMFSLACKNDDVSQSNQVFSVSLESIELSIFELVLGTTT